MRFSACFEPLAMCVEDDSCWRELIVCTYIYIRSGRYLALFDVRTIKYLQVFALHYIARNKHSS